MKLIAVILLSAALQLTPLQSALAGPPATSNPGLDRLNRISGGSLEVVWNEAARTPAVLAGMLSAPSNHSPEWIAGTFVQRNKKLYGLRYPDRDMRIVDVVRHPGSLTAVRFQLYLYDTPVWGDGLVVQIDERGVVRRAEGCVHYDLRKATFHRPKQAAVSEQRAAATAIASLRSSGVQVKTTSVQRYYLPNRPGIPLIYVVTLRLDDQGEHEVMIHALNNRVIAES
ncbi:hypothetical protein [Cohnella fermenti]|uniref:PepSY domain-containing protein n=1 Tax=Cohnella fermenti TaxID=2565925 RepID=A0A4S4BQH6_9BACL|nr:hypothetical protein [Cohnella fermenti]THF76370.1 hypothetical protein E6C55_19030 [Cohnella fermenti]